MCRGTKNPPTTTKPVEQKTTSTPITSLAIHTKQQSPVHEHCNRMLSIKAVSNIFPYHIQLDGDLVIKSVGKNLPWTLGVERDDLIGKFADSFFSFVQPHVTHWSLKAFKGLEDQDISIEPVFPSPVLKSRLVLSGGITCTSHSQQEYLFILTPDAESLKQLNLRTPRYGPTGNSSSASGTTVSTSSINQKVVSLTAELRKEQGLLESLMPRHAAEGLRNGHHVDPILHENVTMFFSDIAGFTNMCDQIFPWGKFCSVCILALEEDDETNTLTFHDSSRHICSNRNHRCLEPSVLHYGSSGKEVWCEC